MAHFERALGLFRGSETLPTRLAVPFATSLLLAASACSSLASETDVLADSVPGDGPWRCYGSVGNGQSVPDNPSRLDYTTRVYDLATRRPPRNLTVRGCTLFDLNCLSPVLEATEPDTDGRLVLPLTEGFEGFLELTADDMVPTLFVFAGALSRERASRIGSHPISMLAIESLQGLEASLRVQIAPGAGRVAITTLDCDAQLAAGVRIEMAAPAVPFALIAGLPVARQDTTSADGVVGFVNVALGVALVSATIVELDAALDRLTLPIRTGWVTQTTLVPGSVPLE